MYMVFLLIAHSSKNDLEFRMRFEMSQREPDLLEAFPAELIGYKAVFNLLYKQLTQATFHQKLSKLERKKKLLKKTKQKN